MTPQKIYGLVGFPVKHSLSPAMHNAAFAALKINAEYKLFELKPQELEGFFKAAAKNNIFGLNVTVPYKEQVIPFLSKLSEAAKLTGAVNTVKVSDAGLEGFNTDGEGFIKHLKEGLRFDPAGKAIALIGAGGAAKAVSVYLCRENPQYLSIFDVDKEKSVNLSRHLKENFQNLDIKAVDSIQGLNIGASDLLINATPIGMKEQDPCLVDEKLIHSGLLVYDLIYNPKETRLLKTAELKGAKTANGLGMLLYQGAAAFEVWTNQKAPVEIMRKALVSALG